MIGDSVQYEPHQHSSLEEGIFSSQVNGSNEIFDIVYVSHDIDEIFGRRSMNMLIDHEEHLSNGHGMHPQRVNMPIDSPHINISPSNNPFHELSMRQVQETFHHYDDSTIDEMDVVFSPELQVKNARIQRMRWWLRLGRETKSFFVAIILIYTIYLQISSKNTDNWETTRLMGLSEPRLCTSSKVLYGVAPFNIFTWEEQSGDIGEKFFSSAYKPFAFIAKNRYVSSDSSRKESICLSAQTLISCSSVLSSIVVG
jgi:hypothetical protein